MVAAPLNHAVETVLHEVSLAERRIEYGRKGSKTAHVLGILCILFSCLELFRNSEVGRSNEPPNRSSETIQPPALAHFIARSMSQICMPKGLP